MSKKTNKTKTILCVTPSYDGNIHPAVQQALAEMIVPEGYVITFRTIRRKLIHVARNMAVAEAIGGKYDYLLFCDDDNAPEKDALQLLIEADKDIVCGIIRKRSYPHDLAIYGSEVDLSGFVQYNEFKNVPMTDSNVFRIANCGTGFVLYKTEMLQGAYIAYDYMPFESRMIHYVPTRQGIRVEAERSLGNPLIKMNKDGSVNVMKRHLSEDLLFHERCEKGGYPIYAHKLVNLIHYDGEKEIRVETKT